MPIKLKRSNGIALADTITEGNILLDLKNVPIKRDLSLDYEDEGDLIFINHLQ